jgi:hypothetical protein
MPSHYSSIGFRFQSDEEFQEGTARLSAAARKPIVTKRGSYFLCKSESGAALWLQVNRQGELDGAHPHFHGESKVAIRATSRVHGDSDTELDGSFHAWANPEPNLEGDYPFVFDSPNFYQLADVALPAEGTAQIAAFADEVTLYGSQEEYSAAQDGDEVKFASHSFIPAGLFGNKGDSPAAHAIFTGHVVRAERKVNELGGGEFIWALVETLGGTYDVVFDPEICSTVPPPGNVLSGTFWLSGLCESLDSKAGFGRKVLHRLRGGR